MPARVSTSPLRASSVEYSSFLDSVLDHVCCSSTANRRGNNYNHNYQDRDRSRDDCHNDDCTNVPNNALRCGAGRDNDGCIPRQMRRGSRESSTSFFGKNIHSGAKNVHHDHPDRDCNSQLPEIILQHLKFQPLPIDAASYDFHCSTTSNGNAGEKSPSAAEAETAHMTVSSLDEFYNLFLANDAPHSFFKFHEKNGDEDIEITPWKKVAVVCDTQSNAKYCNNKSNATMKEMERTITFQTRMTSSSSGHSFTFGSSNKSNSSKKDIANSSSTTTPSSMTLGVIVVQRLIRHFARNPTGNNNDNSAHNHAQGRKYLKWILESHISFDYSDGNRGNDDDGNYGNNHPCSIFNNLGGKLSMGLGSFLVSNEVKCSTVCVRVILTEGDGITGVTPPSSPQSMRNDCRSGSNSDVLHNQEGTEGSAEDTASPQSAHGYLSFFFHPLLLPPDSLCGGGGKWNQGKEGYSPAPVTPTKKSPSKSASMSTNPLLDLENGCMGGGCTSPSELGASLLSAIKAKNDPRDDINLTNDADENDDFSGTAAELTVPETPPPTPPPSQSLLDPSSFMDLVTNTQKQIMNIANESDNDVAQSSTCQRKSAETLLLRNKQLTQQDDDILSSNTSRGSLKLKHISSFEYAREPSVSSASEGHMAMRRMILEKDSQTKMFSSGKTQRGKSSSRDAPSLDVTGTEPFAVLPSSSFSSFPNSIVNTPVSLQGLSMRIEMQVRSPTTGPVSNTSSSSTSTTYSSYCSPSNNNSNSSDSQSFGTSALTIPFHRSKGSFSSPLDEKILRNIRKRVSRTWISWAESWCMRIWEEEEAERSRRKSMGLAAGSSSLIPRRSSRNVRPVVRRLSSGRRKRDVLGGCVQGSGRCSTGGGTVRNESPLALSSFVSRSLSNLSMNSTASFSRPLGDRWQPFDIRSILSDSSKISFFGDRIEKWMFVVGKNGVGGGDIGIEVTCMFTMKQNLLLRVSSPPTVSMSFVRPDVDACLQPKRESKTSEPIQTQVPEKNSDVASIDAKTGRNSRRNGWKKALSMRKTIETKIIKKPVL